jgi:hypothetical protein
MTTALAVRQQQLNPDIWQTITAVAPVMKDSRLFGVSTEAQAAAIMAKGYELGLTLTAAFEFIHVIENKPSLSPRGALALVLQSGQAESIKIEDLKDAQGNPFACRVSMKRRGGFEYGIEFSMDDAKRAGLVKPGSGWEKYPSSMLKWRAVGYCIDVVFSDVVGGMKRSDEFGAAIDGSGNVVDAMWTPVTSAPSAPAVVVDVAPVMNTSPAATLQDLVQVYGPEKVMEVNGGRIPASDAEVAAVERTLAG